MARIQILQSGKGINHKPIELREKFIIQNSINYLYRKKKKKEKKRRRKKGYKRNQAGLKGNKRKQKSLNDLFMHDSSTIIPWKWFQFPSWSIATLPTISPHTLSFTFIFSQALLRFSNFVLYCSIALYNFSPSLCLTLTFFFVPVTTFFFPPL